MKKICIFVTTLLIGMSAFAGEAWKNHVGFGWKVPTGITVSGINDNKDWNLKMPVQTGIDFSYTGVHMESGFSVRAFMDYNLSTSNLASMNPKDTDLIGFNYTSALGAGWAPVRNNNFLLGFYGMLGFDMSIFPETYSDPAEGNTQNSITVTYGYGALFLGANATFIWTPTGKRFSIFGSATAGYNLPGIILYNKEDVASARNRSTTDKLSDYWYVSGSFKVIPTLGVSWRF